MNTCDAPAIDLPCHVAIIMDGNRRWAKERGVGTKDGHRAGFERFREIVQASFDRGIKYVTVYAFSTENWKRTDEEVGALMNLMTFAVKSEIKKYQESNVQVRIIGRRTDLPRDLQEELTKIEADTASKDGNVLNVAISYGGRAEIIDAVTKASRLGEITEDSIANNLYTAGQPDPELIIRTGGQPRLSNFLLWQAAYSEVYFTDVLWPDFNETELDKSLAFYAKIKRNFGK